MKLTPWLLWLAIFSPLNQRSGRVVMGDKAILSGDERDLDRLLSDLGAEEVERREEATRILLQIGKEILPILEGAAKQTNDSEVKARLRFVIGELRGVRAELTFEETKISSGERFRWSVRVRNERSLPVILVRALWSSRVHRQFPLVDIEVEKPDGGIVAGHSFQRERTGHVNPPTIEDLIEVGPGDTFDPFGGKDARDIKVSWFEGWKPAPGHYRARFVYDSTPKDWAVWIADEPKELMGPGGREKRRASSGARDLAIPEFFHHIYHARIVSEWIDLLVD